MGRTRRQRRMLVRANTTTHGAPTTRHHHRGGSRRCRSPRKRCVFSGIKGHVVVRCLVATPFASTATFAAAIAASSRSVAMLVLVRLRWRRLDHGLSVRACVSHGIRVDTAATLFCSTTAVVVIAAVEGSSLLQRVLG